MTWFKETDYLRCSPMFSGQPRYDGVLFNEGEGETGFGKLLFTFIIDIDGKSIPMALIQQLDIPRG